jgi:Fe-S oxidoreductase
MDQKQLRELEEHCIQEHAPACTAGCPVHVDVRAMMAEASQGNFAAAQKLIQKTLPFPRIISQICDQPCQTACKRGELGGALQIAALERVCLEMGGLPADSIKPLPARGKRVAVIGAGLSGLTAAFDLLRKGYAVTIFEAESAIGGQLRQRQSPLDELSIVEQIGAEVRLNTPVDLDALPADFDAVYLAWGVKNGIQVDSATFAVNAEGLFAGGSLLREQYSPIQSVADGRRAAISMDRYLQRVSLTAGRQNEGSYSTRLYTNLTGIEPQMVVAEIRIEADAIHEAQRCIHCECMECVKNCAYLAQYESYPKRYIRQIYNNLSIVMGTRHANKLINSCSLCGLCAEICPEHVDMAQVCKDARQTMVSQERMPPSAHDFALRDLEFSHGDQFALSRNAPGTSTSEYVFFPGCQLAASSPQHVEAVYNHLRQSLDGSVGLMLDCCGAPADWAGRTDLVQGIHADIMMNLTAMGSPKVVLACSSCYQIFKEQMPDVEIISLWEVLDHYPLLEINQGSGIVSIHDPCTARYETQIQDSVRRLVQKAGYEIEELPLSRERTECCTYGGLMWLANPSLSQTVVQRRVDASPNDYVTYCAVCRDFFAAQGKRSFHVLDLLFGGDVGQSIGYSERHENRARLKRKFLSTYWGEAVPELQDYEKIQLILSAAIKELLDQRLILVGDIQQVIHHAETTSSKLLNLATRRFLANYRLGNVTFWVEYSAQGESFVIHNAYCHRMEIKNE